MWNLITFKNHMQIAHVKVILNSHSKDISNILSSFSMGHRFVPKDWIFLILFYFFKWSQLLTTKNIFNNAKAPHCSFHWDLKDLKINWLKQDLILKTKACCKSCKTPHWNVNLQNGNAFGSYENSSFTLTHLSLTLEMCMNHAMPWPLF